LFEWVVTDAPDAALVGVGQLDPARNAARNTRATLQVAAALPGSFTVEDEAGAVMIRGKCSDIGHNIMQWGHGEPIRMARTFYNNAHRAVFKLGEAQMGIYL
jgi:hypothetical protein